MHVIAIACYCDFMCFVAQEAASDMAGVCDDVAELFEKFEREDMHMNGAVETMLKYIQICSGRFPNRRTAFLLYVEDPIVPYCTNHYYILYSVMMLSRRMWVY